MPDKIARKMGLKKKDTLTQEQFELFVSGQGNENDPQSAALADVSVLIFTNTIGRGLYEDTVLASYGLFVNKDGLLQSLANPEAPTRKANVLLERGGYIDTWFRANGATASLVQLYESAYSVEADFGYEAQQNSDPYQLVTNIKKGRTQVGMSMAPALWLTNFALLYTLNPATAAYMPAYWTPIPPVVAAAIRAPGGDGQVEWDDYKQYFPTEMR